MSDSNSSTDLPQGFCKFKIKQADEFVSQIYQTQDFAPAFKSKAQHFSENLP